MQCFKTNFRSRNTFYFFFRGVVFVSVIVFILFVYLFISCLFSLPTIFILACFSHFFFPLCPCGLSQFSLFFAFSCFSLLYKNISSSLILIFSSFFLFFFWDLSSSFSMISLSHFLRSLFIFLIWHSHFYRFLFFVFSYLSFSFYLPFFN